MQRHPFTAEARGTCGPTGRALPPTSPLGRGLRALPFLAVAACADPERTTATTKPRAAADDTASAAALAVGAADAVAAAVFPGRWSGLMRWQHVAIHMHLLPNGKVLTWPGGDHDGQENTPERQATLWDPATNTFQAAPNMFTNVFCSGHTHMADGRLFVAGGHEGRFYGSSTISFFDYQTSSWSRGSAMNAGRWYPTAVTLGNGDVLIVGGTTGSGSQNRLPQVWSPSSGLRLLTGARASVPYYPWLFVAPSGRVFYAGPSTAQTGYLSTAGTGAWQISGTPFSTDATIEGEGAEREYGSAVILDGVVLRMGGGGWSNRNGTPGPVGPDITNAAERIDLKVANPTWSSIAPMNRARRHLNAVILPDRTVFVAGGTSEHGTHWAGSQADAVFESEIYDQATNTWTMGPRMAKSRLYHSTAVLLPDGRVLVAGGGTPRPPDGTDNLDAQIYSPPYLFDASGNTRPRPVVSEVPERITYGQAFRVRVSYSAGGTPAVRRVTLVRLGSPTHAFDASQRLVTLAATQRQKRVSLTAPANGNAAPPGPYLLFVLDESGTPSVGKVVQLR